MGIIQTDTISYDYIRTNEDGNTQEVYRALDQVSIDIYAGSFIAILGSNGSGKSTLAKHLNALLAPSEGTVWVDGKRTDDPESVMPIRKSAGMVFQNPDNQIIANIVEEDVGFGPENLGVETEDIWKRVEDALTKVGMLSYRSHSPNKLSGGQKQRVAIAGVLAMHPKCIVLDEPTAMLDPNGRREVIETITELNQKEGVTVILITHYMEEVVGADHIFVMNDGKLAMEGNPRTIFSQVEKLHSYKLGVPQMTQLAYELKQSGLDLPDGILTERELSDALVALPVSGKSTAEVQVPAERETSEALLELKDVRYVYSSGTAYEIEALKGINLKIEEGQLIGIVGHTGSGKSTMIQHLNGLLKPTSGTILFRGQDIFASGYKRKDLRSNVGLVFQYPEYQLFETSVLADVCYGPLNQGLSKTEAEEQARKALAAVGVPEKFYDRSPFELSGGQKRRVAIAGVIAMNPAVLVLDEPTAGLDPYGRDEILGLIRSLHEDQNMTVVLISHSMEDMADYADRLIVMSHGQMQFDDTPRNVFTHVDTLEEMGLAVPQVTYLMQDLAARGLPVRSDCITVEECRKTILEVMKPC